MGNGRELISFVTIGHNIREARRQLGLTQEQVAEKIGLSLLHFGRLERGDRKASLEQIAQIARVLNVSVSSLLRGSMEEETLDLGPDANAKELGEYLAHLACKCSPVMRKGMLAVCEALAENGRLF